MANFTLVIANKNYSSWSLRGWLAMKRTGADFDEIVIPLHLPETAERIRAHSPSGKVPVLIHPAGTVWDSLAIVEFLAERFPGAGLWPEDPSTRAVARSVAAEMHAGFMTLRRTHPMNLRARLPARPDDDAVAADIGRIQEIWATCRKEYGNGGPFLFGEFSVADVFYAPVVSRFKTFGIALNDISTAYANALWQWPDMQEWIAAAEQEPHVIEAYDH